VDKSALTLAQASEYRLFSRLRNNLHSTAQLVAQYSVIKRSS
jgi:hypothetical protein